MLVTFQNKLQEATGHIIYIWATLHFFCIFLCSSCSFDQSHSLMEADCAHKIPGRPLCGTTECEMGLFHQQACKTPFYKHYFHYKVLRLHELFMFSNFLVTFRYLKALTWFGFWPSKAKNCINYFVCILSIIFSTIIHTFCFILRVEKSYFWWFSLHPP